MKHFMIGILAMTSIASLAIAAIASDDRYNAIYGVEYTAEKQDCGFMCGETWYHVIYCTSTQTCCGWVDCDTGNSQGTCCNPGTTCDPGLDSDPPSQPICVVNP